MKRRTLAEAFGAATRRLRTDRNYSQEGFAHHAGISRTYMSEIERGVTNVSLETIDRIAKALKVGMSELIAQTEMERNKSG